MITTYMNPQDDGRDRAKLAAESPLGPESLCGSYFVRLENDEVDWAGIVVAEPQPGIYLLALLDANMNTTHQRIVALERMTEHGIGETEWRFYDHDTWLRLLSGQQDVTMDEREEA